MLSIPAWLSRTIWVTTVLLVVIGIAASAARVVFLADAAKRMDPIRKPMFDALGLVDPLQADRPLNLQLFDERYASHPGPTLAHVVAGGILLALVPLQFVARIRDRYRRWHRWSGRLLVALAAAATVTGVYFGLVIPFDGGIEIAAVVLFAAWLLLALTRAVVAIRRGQVSVHREWMIRAFATVIGISMIRVVGAPVDLVLAPRGVPPQESLAVALWVGWVLTLAAGEAWIRYTRRVALAGSPQTVRKPHQALPIPAGPG